jgi:hypothetical protein
MNTAQAIDSPMLISKPYWPDRITIQDGLRYGGEIGCEFEQCVELSA